MRTTAGLHTQPGDTPTANLCTKSGPFGTYLEVNLAGGIAPDATLYVNDPAFLDALLDVLSVKAAEWKVQQGDACGCGRTLPHFHTRASGCTPRMTAVDR